jgi:Xaa-Pro aminopeptidase
MARENVSALVAIGNQNIGGSAGTGNFRYLTDFFIIYQYAVLLFFREGTPILLVSSELQRDWAKKYSWIEDVRACSDYPEIIARLLNDRGLGQTKIGIAGMESIPAKTYLAIKEKLPKADFFDAGVLLSEMKLIKGDEEKGLLQRAAEINDEAYKEVIKYLRPGIREYEIVGILEGYQFRNGADRTFNLISTGPFPASADGTPFQYHPWFPGNREIQTGDCVLMEITTVYGGYWNQLVRVVSVGRENPELLRFQQAIVKTIQAGLEKLRVGMKTTDFINSMAIAAERDGFKLNPIMGHFVGLDLTEARFYEAEGQVVFAPNIAIIIHPTISNSQEISMFWGQTYLTTDNEPVKLNRTEDILLNL